MAAAATSPYLTFSHSRTRRMQEELQYALRHTSKTELVVWGAASAGRFGSGLWRRGKSLYRIAKATGKLAYCEVREGIRAGQEGRLAEHGRDRASKVKAFGTKAATWIRDHAQELPSVARSLKDHPAEAAPRMLGATLGFLSGSGGFDANGGVLSPDMDLMFGIGAHRSVLTHTLILGAAAEATILSFAELAKIIHQKLPRDHDILWDHLASHGQNFAIGLATGYGVGLAYHLGVDATVQAAPLHGIPVPMPMEAHQAVMLGSSVAEVGVQARRLQSDSSSRALGNRGKP